jgi:O-antigen/teichoic acid export membrane protein
LAGRVSIFVYGRDYSNSTLPLQIVASVLFLKFINFLCGYVLASINEQNRRMFGQGLTAGFNVLANIILIQKMGYIGAAYAALLTEIFLFVLYYWYVSKLFYVFNFAPILVKPLLAAVGMFMFIKFANFGLTMTIILSAIVYFILIFLLRTFEKDDYDILNKILRTKEAAS